MRAVNFSNSNSRTTRLFAAALAASMAVSPVAAQTASAQTDSAAPATTTHKKATTAASKTKKRTPNSARAARTARIHQAFVASTELRPMAQQLATLRTPAAYAGVTKYAHAHTGEAASAAYLALGHAYLADRRFTDAAENLHLARPAGQELAEDPA